MTSAEATQPLRRATAMSSYVYVYGVRRAGSRNGGVSDGIGGATVREIVHRDLAAVASDVPEARIRATRRDLMRHSNVLTDALDSGQVLPLRFGTLYPDDATVVDALLAARYGELTNLLSAFEDKVEVSVKAFYDEQAILAEVVARNPRIRRLRDATRGQPAAATHGLRIELGEAVAHAVEEQRAADADRIIRRVRPLVDDLFVDDQQVENLVVKAALLVDRNRLDAVDAAMDELAREQVGRMQFKYVGPLPPHSFVALELQEQA